MINLSLLGLITIIILFVAVLFSFFSFTVKTSNKTPNVLIAFYLLAVAIEISFFFYEGQVNLPLIIHKLRDDVGYLKSPLLYLFFLSIIYSNFQLQVKHLLHLIPFVIVIVVFIPRFYLVNEATRALFVQTYITQPEAIFSALFAHLQHAFYLVLIFVALKDYRQIIAENYSDNRGFSYHWLRKMAWFLTFIFLLAVFKNVYKHIGTNLAILNHLRSVLFVALLFFLCWIVINALYYPMLFRGISIDQKPIADAEKSQKQPSKSTPRLKLAQNEAEEKIALIKQTIESQTLYLDPGLTIDALATQVNLPTKEVSTLINHYLQQHFYDFVNEYRIKKAIEILEDPVNDQLTTLEILYEVGFNSKSSFYTVFKKYTHTTPLAYRKEYRRKHAGSSGN
ncbi:MAG TPA: AraC family transcriptional regulator [Microscillaceae bacterium]|nr:AraC family transcriptional regulator [Microscillaceae bacterium]